MMIKIYYESIKINHNPKSLDIPDYPYKNQSFTAYDQAKLMRY